MKFIALIWSILIFTGSLHSCIWELNIVRTSGGSYISVFQEDCHSNESHCHQQSNKNDSEDSGCCDFGICSCTLHYISDYVDVALNSNLPEFRNTHINYISTQLYSSFTGDIFEPPQAA